MTASIPTKNERAFASEWQRALRHAVRDVDELARLLGLPAEALAARADDDPRFSLLVPRGYIARMARGRLDDPLLLQVLPQRAERIARGGFSSDPLAERNVARGGVLQKYQARALLVTTAACPIHCRYCFRREFPYTEQLAARADWGPALDVLAAQHDLREVILSGGDPLSLSNRQLGRLLERLARLEHMDTLRIHTRFPIVLPERIEPELTTLLANFPRKVVVVVHCNHAQELSPAVGDGLRRLHAGVDLLLNQAVLLRRVNDDPDTLEQLSRGLFELRVLPYYLHALDKVTGTAHFEVDDRRARALIEQLRGRLPGYLVPRLVRETPGDAGKAPL